MSACRLEQAGIQTSNLPVVNLFYLSHPVAQGCWIHQLRAVCIWQAAQKNSVFILFAWPLYPLRANSTPHSKNRHLCHIAQKIDTPQPEFRLHWRRGIYCRDAPTYTHTLWNLTSSILYLNKCPVFKAEKKFLFKLSLQFVPSLWNSTCTGVCLWALLVYLGLSWSVSLLCQCACSLCFVTQPAAITSPWQADGICRHNEKQKF